MSSSSATDGPEFLPVTWGAPPHVRVVQTTRNGGVSAVPYDSLNLGSHVGDRPEAVRENRERLTEAAGLPQAPTWLNQVHGTTVLTLPLASQSPTPFEADGAVVHGPGAVAAILTADCLPIVLAHRTGSCAAVLHGGWRGMVGGIIEAGFEALGEHPAELMAWLGPAIGPDAFVVGNEVAEAVLKRHPFADRCLKRNGSGRTLLDLPSYAALVLARFGVPSIAMADRCTVSDPEHFFSHRRDGTTGRQATLVWLT